MTRHRYSVSAGSVAAPVRLRRRRRSRRIPAWARVATLVGVVCVIVLGLWIGLDERFYVMAPVVVGAQTVAPERIVRASGLLGLHVLWIRSEAAESNIALEPGIDSATVRCELPANCQIEVTETPPQITWQDGGEMWQVDALGLVTPIDSPIDGAWYVQGPLPAEDGDRLDGSVLVGLQELGAWGVDLTQGVYYTPDQGIAFADPRGWLAIVGVGRGMARRLESLEYVAAELQLRGAKPKWVDVHLPDRPFLPLRSDDSQVGS